MLTSLVFRVIPRHEREVVMALLLIILGLILWLTVAPVIGWICIVVGIILFFVEAVPYGFHSFGGRRGARY
jgi:1,4-dihydroxy-2-naphthoate octaprenyltransferase